MTLEIVQFGHPALRAKGRRIQKIDARIRRLAEDMLETMYDAEGVGLAAQQIGMPIQLCVVDVAGVKDRPSVLRIDGNAVEIEAHMPLILINPEVETERRSSFKRRVSWPERFNMNTTISTGFFSSIEYQRQSARE
jgi:peptide deformylase